MTRVAPTRLARLLASGDASATEWLHAKVGLAAIVLSALLPASLSLLAAGFLTLFTSPFVNPRTKPFQYPLLAAATIVVWIASYRVGIWEDLVERARRLIP